MSRKRTSSTGIRSGLNHLQQSNGGISSNPKAKIPEIELLREYRRIQMELNKTPSINDMKAHSRYDISTYIRRYGSWSAFREAVNNPILELQITKEQLIKNYHYVKQLLGKVPTGVELGQHGRFGIRTYHKYFGGHNKLLKLLGEK